MALNENQLSDGQQSNGGLQRRTNLFNHYYEQALKEISDNYDSLDDEQAGEFIQKKLKSFNEYWEKAKKEKIRVKELEYLAKAVGNFDPNVHVVVTKEQLDITKQIQSLTNMAKQIDELHRAGTGIDIREEIKQGLVAALDPPKKAKKLTPAEQFEQDVKAKSQERIIQSVKKAAQK